LPVPVRFFRIPFGCDARLYSLAGPVLAVLVIILGYCVLAHLVKTWFVRRWGM
jgi:hypothetical protein